MIDIELVRKHSDKVIEGLGRRGVPREDVVSLIDYDELWRKLTTQAEDLRSRQNEASRAIGEAAPGEREVKIKDARSLTEELKSIEAQLADAAEKREAVWRMLPNLPEDDVPEGGEEDALELRRVPESVPEREFEQKHYLDLMPEDEIDLARAAKVSGSRFAYLSGNIARLQLALVNFAIDTVSAKGFIPVIPPVLVSREAMSGMGYMDKHSDEVYQTQDDLVLVGTSEQSLGPRHKDEILAAEDLPLRYAGYSSCFRREAGSHGKDVRGILRMHQFDKVEMFSIVPPGKSREEHDFLLSVQEELMQALGLPYRVMVLATRDLGMPAAKTYDIETWLPGEARYRETHSTSNTTDYQSRRLNIRVKDADGKVEKAHMLNGTAFAIGRILIAIIENYQQSDGSVCVPEALKKYVPFEKIG